MLARLMVDEAAQKESEADDTGGVCVYVHVCVCAHYCLGGESTLDGLIRLKQAQNYTVNYLTECVCVCVWQLVLLRG